MNCTKKILKPIKLKPPKNTSTTASPPLYPYPLIFSDSLLGLSIKLKTLTKVSKYLWTFTVETVFTNIYLNYLNLSSKLLKNVWTYMKVSLDMNLPSLNMTKFSAPNLTVEPWKTPDLSPLTIFTYSKKKLKPPD